MGQKKVGLVEFSVEKRRQLIEPERSDISIVRQCELFDLARSSYYYEPCSESAENLALMRRHGYHGD
jgi:putative transposase